MSDPVNVSPDTRFDEASDAQFREFWEAQGWKFQQHILGEFALRKTKLRVVITIAALSRCDAEVWATNRDSKILFPTPIATFGEALRLANNLAQAELFGGWAE